MSNIRPFVFPFAAEDFFGNPPGGCTAGAVPPSATSSDLINVVIPVVPDMLPAGFPSDAVNEATAAAYITLKLSSAAIVETNPEASLTAVCAVGKMAHDQVFTRLFDDVMQDSTAFEGALATIMEKFEAKVGKRAIRSLKKPSCVIKQIEEHVYSVGGKTIIETTNIEPVQACHAIYHFMPQTPANIVPATAGLSIAEQATSLLGHICTVFTASK